ncbi:helicase, partial [Campylobacter coli]|nr:helicase [Campylobacter coli]
VLHREQSRVLKRLLSNESLILSAPTSFGKSFIIDALIAMKKPTISCLTMRAKKLIGKLKKIIKFVYFFEIFSVFFAF